MREYDRIPNDTWVLARKQLAGGKRKSVIGWVTKYTGLCYVVFQPDIQKEVYVSHEYVWSLSIDDEARKDAIDYAIDRKDKEWFMELTGGTEV